jgi:hypothetical protein
MSRSLTLLTAATVLAATLMLSAPAAARGGGGFCIRPGYVPAYSGIDLPHAPAVTVGFGGRGVSYIGPFLRIGGEGFYDPRVGIGTGGFLLDGVIPLPGILEVHLGGVVGGGGYGLYVEPGLGLHLGKGVFAFEVRLSYQWHPVPLERDTTTFHRGLTYLTFGFMFGKF